MSKVLILIDPQNDFIDGGSLAVNGSKAKMIALAEYINNHAKDYDFIIASADFHPFTHCSFKKNGGIWPLHCLQHSEGAAIFQPILDAIDKTGIEFHVLTKGIDEDHEEYSVLKNTKSLIHMQGLIHSHKIEEVDFCGIADIYCVKDSISDFHREFPNVKISVFPEFVGYMDEEKFKAFLNKNEFIEVKNA
jgi:nicotinamidase/pyrazinamidase